MANITDNAATIQHLGAQNLVQGTEAEKAANFRDIWTNEVIGAYETQKNLSQYTRERKIMGGDSATFASMWKTDADYHVKGTQIDIKNIAQSEMKIYVDTLLYTAIGLGQLDELILHYNPRAEFTNQMLNALHRQNDSNICKVMANGARDGARFKTKGGADPTNVQVGIGDLTSGAVLTGYTRTASSIEAGLKAAALRLDAVGAPKEGRVCLLSPTDYYSLIGTTSIMADRNYGMDGSVQNARVPNLYNFMILQDHTYAGVQAMPVGTGAGQASELVAGVNPTNKYSASSAADGYTKSIGLCFHREAAVTLKLLDIQSEAWWDSDTQTYKMLVKQACGHGVVQHQNIVELQTA